MPLLINTNHPALIVMKSLKLAASKLSISVDSIIDILSENFEDNEIHSMSVNDLVFHVNDLADFEDNYDHDTFHNVYQDDRNY
jgi:hypothetical protein